MNYKDHFLELRDFLGQYTSMWNQEIIYSYPDSLNFYPDEWIEQISKISEQELYELDCQFKYESIDGAKGSMREVFEKRKKLCVLPTFIPEKIEEFPKWTFMRVKDKKRHEISILAPLVSNYCHKNNIKKIIDLGGGMGHFARTLSHCGGIQTTSIDFDKKLQRSGQARANQYPLSDKAESLNFINLDFSIKSKELEEVFKTKNSMSVGLHTCGVLAKHHINLSIENQLPSILNFGCCYTKLDSIKDTHLSKIAKEKPFEFSNHAMTLATRGHAKMTIKDFRLKKRVKRFRYTLHLLLFDELGIKDICAVGEVPSHVYNGSFAAYAKSRLDYLNIKYEFSDKFLEDFIDDKKRKEFVSKLFHANIIRWQFGRAIELYMLLDRSLFLEENGYEVDLRQYFDETISPRNIGIWANKKEA